MGEKLKNKPVIGAAVKPEILEKLKRISKKDGKNISELIREALDRYTDENEEPTLF